MAKKSNANKYWIYGEDAALAARFTKYLTKVLYAKRASYVRTKMAEAAHEVSIEECSDSREKNPELKQALQDLGDYLFRW